MRKTDMQELFTNELINEMYPKTSKEFWNFYAKDIQKRYFIYRSRLDEDHFNGNDISKNFKEVEALYNITKDITNWITDATGISLKTSMDTIYLHFFAMQNRIAKNFEDYVYYEDLLGD